MIECTFTYNDSSNRVHPVSDIISKECSNKPNDVGDHIKEVILSICLDNLIGKWSTVKNQKQFYQSHREHNTDDPALLLLGQAEITILQKVREPINVTWPWYDVWVVDC